MVSPTNKTDVRARRVIAVGDPHDPALCRCHGSPDQICNVLQPGSWFTCTLAPGHMRGDLPHVAFDSKQVVAVWS